MHAPSNFSSILAGSPQHLLMGLVDSNCQNRHDNKLCGQQSKCSNPNKDQDRFPNLKAWLLGLVLVACLNDKDDNDKKRSALSAKAQPAHHEHTHLRRTVTHKKIWQSRALPGVIKAKSHVDWPSRETVHGDYHMGHQSCASLLAQDIGGKWGLSMLFSTSSPTQVEGRSHQIAVAQKLE